VQHGDEVVPGSRYAVADLPLSSLAEDLVDPREQFPRGLLLRRRHADGAVERSVVQGRVHDIHCLVDLVEHGDEGFSLAPIWPSTSRVTLA
jgi:hypothetical protein